MRAACLAAFASDIKRKRRVDAFFVSINKEMTVDQKRRKKGEAAEALRGVHGGPSGVGRIQGDPRNDQGGDCQDACDRRMSDKWLKHPFPNMSEPEKAIAYLTDMGDYDADHLVALQQGEFAFDGLPVHADPAAADAA